jgi:hypothetical protein
MSLLRRVLTTFAVSTAVVVLTASCKPKAGGKCQPGQGACADPRNALTCGTDQKFMTMACKGPNGCVIDPGSRKVQCDDSVADDGDVCLMSQSENFACSVDKKKALKCEAGTFKVYENCRGPKACSIKHDWATMTDDVFCDTTMQNKGDPCIKPGNVVCSADLKQMLQCKDGTYDIYRYCRGASGCSVQHDGPHCDESLAELNDPCGMPGMVVCSNDGKAELICRGGKFLHERECKKTGCHLTARNSIDCN